MAANAHAPGPVSEAGQNLEFIDLLAYIYLQHGLPDKAAVLLSARGLLAPDHPRALLTLALAWVRSAKPRKALEVLERLAILGAMDAQFHLVRAQALQALDRADEAASAMRAYIGLLPVAVAAATAGPSSARY
ncbi:tetratricopeptide repeat protein [Comamonas antarctica]|uniref:Uncharacterized protein n=1 Tax=Comamonas antarctica TaxID=2743470 RepID=A0A6N1X943_9BURK|nr:hypothetical protein [Comamonas antarctica]QKV54375.1 hypothetical protein HUK68_16475 [Comamonas antarctica]